MTDMADFGVYIHWPFCQKKCPYCDFNSHVRETVDQARYGQAIITELETMAERFHLAKRPVKSVFFGGGTPSLMLPEITGEICVAIKRLFTATDDIEITLEANPTSVEAEKLAAFHDHGINRLSMGIQSLNDRHLSFLGREHSAKEALGALAKAQHVFERVSIDFIYALPDQTTAEWLAQLADILALGCDHLSLYQLTLEQGTAFTSMAKRGLLDMPTDELSLEMFKETQAHCRAAGFHAYEISNHAKSGQMSRHNLIYWRADDWIGAGPGAVGRIWSPHDNSLEDNHEDNDRRIETRCRKHPDGWLDDVTKTGSGIAEENQEKPHAYAIEAVMMGLRLADGINIAAIESKAGARHSWLDTDAVARYCQQGLLNEKADILKLTEHGKTIMNTLIGEILIL